MTSTDTATTAVTASESFVQRVINDIQTEVQVIESDVMVAINWLDGHLGEAASVVAEITTGATGIVNSIAAAGGTLPPETQTAIAALDAATAGLNAAAAAVAANGGANAGSIQGTANVLVAGYAAAKTALAQAQTAAGTLATNPNGSPAVVVAPAIGA